ncbi:MAG: hypothetical protein ACRC62_28755 [Microcoleus sp.]
MSHIAAFWGRNFGGNYKFSGSGASCAKTIHIFEGRRKKEEGRRKKEEGRRKREEVRRKK